MRKLAVVLLLSLVGAAAGCSFYDAMFGMFGSAYSGGGTSRADRQADYDSRVGSYGNSGQSELPRNYSP
jgi:hypothetical protein